MLPGNVGGVARVYILHQSLNPVLANPRRHGRQRVHTVWGLCNQKHSCRKPSDFFGGGVRGRDEFSYVDLEAVVPLNLVLGHVVTLG